MDVTLFNNCDADLCVDIGVACGDVLRGNDLSTAVMLSLFTDRRANDDDAIPDQTTDPRGWWADALDGEKYGSRLWLLDSARNLSETLRLAEDYAREALAWLVSDGVAKSVDVAATAGDCDGVLLLKIGIKKPDGRSLAWRYRYAWDLSQLQSCEEINYA
jgi:phage gp46-like protein